MASTQCNKNDKKIFYKKRTAKSGDFKFLFNFILQLRDMAFTDIENHFETEFIITSAKALKMCCSNYEYTMSFINLHKSCIRATPDEMMSYKLALCLFKLYNSKFNTLEFVGLNFDQILTGRQTNFNLCVFLTFMRLDISLETYIQLI